MSMVDVADFIHRYPRLRQSFAAALEFGGNGQSKVQSEVDCARRPEPSMSLRQQAVENAFMKFRMVWMGPEDEPDRQGSEPEETVMVQDRHPFRYEQHGTGMVRREESRNRHRKLTPLTNFVARIVQDLVLDNDIERSRNFGIEAELGGQKLFFVVAAAEFSRMNWVLRQLGPQAIIYPGQQQHARAAIQSLSGAIRQEQIFTHLGWRKCGQDWMYLQAGGALSASGTLAGCQVRLPTSLRHYQTRMPADPGEVVIAVRASLRLLSVGPERITLPLLASIYRAPFGGVDFSVFLMGRTGTFKTALAALCQQHFGLAMDASSLPGNFASTANALEELAFAAKDAVLVVDDFAPTGGVGDKELYGIAERLFRAAGNHQGRSRMNGHLVASRPPRALIMATGEEVPRGHSLRARLLILQVHPGNVDQGVLTESQRAGHQGLFAAAMGAYLVWMAARHNQLQECLRTRVLEIRGGVHKQSDPIHARLATTLAELQSGFEIWLRFAVEVGAITDAERNRMQERSEKALDHVARLQAPYHRGSDPAFRFILLLQTALATGAGHAADRRGCAPDSPERWGWRKLKGQAWVPQATRFGWVVGNDLFLEPDASYEVAQNIAGTERLPVSSQTLRHRLREHGLLASVDAGRQMLLIRRTLEGMARQVLHLRVHDLLK